MSTKDNRRWHISHADPGVTKERPAGSRSTTTLTKLPTDAPNKMASANIMALRRPKAEPDVHYEVVNGEVIRVSHW